MQETQIAGPQEQSVRNVCERRVKCGVARLFLAPVSGTDRRARYPDLADPTGVGQPLGCRIDDDERRPGYGSSAADKRSSIPVGGVGQLHAALSERGTAQSDHLRFGAERGHRHRQGGLRKPITRGKGTFREAERRENLEKASDGLRVDRLSTACRVHQRAQIARPPWVRSHRLHASRIGKVWRAGMGDPEALDRLQPAQRSAQEGDR